MTACHWDGRERGSSEQTQVWFQEVSRRTRMVTSVQRVQRVQRVASSQGLRGQMPKRNNRRKTGWEEWIEGSHKPE